MITNFSIPGADRNPEKLREYCQKISEDHPDSIVLGQLLFGQFANVEVVRDVRTDSSRITGTHVESTSLGGYWLAGKFQLFSASELALVERDDEDE